MISRLKVKNFKSLKDIDISLRPLTVFVGPNNAGKSNILDSLLFLRDILETGGEYPIHHRAGFRNIVWGGELSRSISIEIEGSAGEENINYFIEIGGTPPPYNIQKERFSVRKDSGVCLLAEAESGKGNLFNIKGEKVSPISGEPPAVYSILRYAKSIPYAQTSEGRLIIRFVNSIERWRNYNFYPANTKRVSPARKTSFLQPTGENLSGVVHTIQSENPQLFDEIEELLKTGVKEIERLLTKLTDQGTTYIAIKEKDLPSPIPITNISDGTLRLLAILTALYSLSPSTLLLFEEPENCIHPYLLEVLADILKSVSERTQILTSTHSVLFLNYLSYEDLVLVEKRRGETVCKPIKDKEGVKEALKSMGLGEFWYSGAIGGVP